MSIELLDRRRSSDVGPDIIDGRRRWIRVAEHRERETVEASFTFALVGVSPKRLEQRPPGLTATRPADLVDVLTLAAAAGQVGGKIWFEYQSGGTQPLACECQVSGSVVAVTAGEALDRVLPLWQETADTFGRADGDYVFEPRLLDDDVPAGLHVRVVRLRRSSLLLGQSRSGSAGFRELTDERCREHVLMAPMTGAWGVLDHTVTALASSPRPVAVRFSIDPVTLTLAELRSLTRSLSWLNSPTPKGLAYTKDPLHAGADPAVQSELSRILACWIRRPFGFRVAAEMRAEGHIPAAVLVALRQDMPGLVPSDEHTPSSATATVFDLTELAHEDLGLPGVLPPRVRLLDLGARPVVASNVNSLPADGPVVGRLPGAGQLVLRIPEKYRDQHTYLAGASGVGKSTVLYNWIVHDLARGHGVCLLDPHGELFDRVLESIPADRIDDVVIIDPYDQDWVVGLNPLAPDGHDAAFERQVATSEMLRLFDRLYDLHVTGGPMFEIYVRNAMFLAMDSPSAGGTLVEVVRIFEDRDFRHQLLDSCADEAVVSFWKQQAEGATGETSLTSMAPYVTSKLNQFTQNAFVRPIIGQSGSTFSFRRVLDEGKIVLVNLAVGQLGVHDVQLLGMLVMAKLFRAAFSRRPSAGRSPRMHVYLDEFHYFLTDAMAGALSQLRKYDVCLTLSHQHFSQLVETRMGAKLLDAVLGNVATKLLFRLGPGDAEKAAGWVRPELRAEDLQRLANYDVVACIPASAGPAWPVIAQTLPHVECPYERASVNTIRSLQHNYARRRSDVEAEIARRRHAVAPVEQQPSRTPCPEGQNR